MMIYNLKPKAWAKSLGLFSGLVPVYYICLPSRLGPGASFADDIFGVQANTLA